MNKILMSPASPWEIENKKSLFKINGIEYTPVCVVQEEMKETIDRIIKNKGGIVIDEIDFYSNLIINE